MNDTIHFMIFPIGNLSVYLFSLLHLILPFLKHEALPLYCLPLVGAHLYNSSWPEQHGAIRSNAMTLRFKGWRNLGTL